MATTGTAPHTMQCSWCGNGIRPGDRVVYEGRMVYHLDRCAPREYRTQKEG